MSKITVIDDIMGSGKTSWALQMMTELPAKSNIMFVTPFLNEVDRIKNECIKHFIDPIPDKGLGKKTEHIKKLIKNGENIATTHALFKKFDTETIQLIKENNYILILDEVIDVVKPENITEDDLQILFDHNLIKTENNRLIWLETSYRGRYEKYKEIIQGNSSYVLNRNKIIWTLPPKVFEAFKETFILTYYFEGQYLKNYFDLYNMSYKKKSIQSFDFGYYTKYELIDYRKPDLSQIAKLITVYEGKHNDVVKTNGNLGRDNLTFTQLSKMEKGSKEAKAIKNATVNVVRTEWKAKSGDVIWTTSKGAKEALKGQGYARSYTSFNLRATNDYRERKHCCYLLNKFPNLDVFKFFEKQELIVNSDLNSLSDMIQWIFRSAIREGNPIKVYIPSDRMRNLLYDWLKGEI